MPAVLGESSSHILLENSPDSLLTTDDMISQVEEHLLGGDRDNLNFLTTGIAATDTTLNLSDALSGVTTGSYLGVDIEVMYVRNIDPTSNQLTVMRGMLGSQAVSHDTGRLVYIDPLFTRWSIFRALNSEISQLSGADNGLFAIKEFTLTTQSVQKTYDVPLANTDLLGVLEIRWDSYGPERYWARVNRRQWQVIRDLQTDTGTSGMSIRIEDSVIYPGSFTPGRRMVVRYYSGFSPLSRTLTDDVTLATGISGDMLDIPALGAAARLMGVRSAKRTFIERAIGSRRPSEVPAGASVQSAQILMKLHDDRVQSEADRLRQLYPVAD